MSYYCEFCEYKTNDSGNYSHHKKSKKHLNIMKFLDSKMSKGNPQYTSSIPESTLTCIPETTVQGRDYKCEKCNFFSKHKSSYYRHQKKCLFFEKPENSENIDKLKLKLEFAEKEKEIFKKIEQEKDLIIKEKTELLNNFMSNANVLLNKANDNTKITAQAIQTVSMSALKYANEKFKNTPALLPLENFNIMNLSFDNIEERSQLVETLVYNAKQKSLDKLLGDHIVKYYKKDNPEEQTFHTTDCSRLNYIVRELIENALIWSVDKNGLKICKEIVKPLIKKCINALMEHQKLLLQEMNNGNFTNQKDVELIIDVIMSIDSGSLENDINKYIAPYFNLNKKLLEDKEN